MNVSIFLKGLLEALIGTTGSPSNSNSSIISFLFLHLLLHQLEKCSNPDDAITFDWLNKRATESNKLYLMSHSRKILAQFYKTFFGRDYSTLFTYWVRWHTSAVSFPPSVVILTQLACPLSDIMFCLHSGRTNLSLFKHWGRLSSADLLIKVTCFVNK